MEANKTPEQAALVVGEGKIPAHIAIIMDGNGRWAQQRSRERSLGHEEGVGSVHNVTQAASDMGVKYLTLYAFSTENWNRPEPEVQTLMYLIGMAIRKETPGLVENNVRIRLSGDIDRLPESVRADLLAGKEATSHCTGMVLNLCLSYSARWELTQAVKGIAEDVEKGLITPGMIDESLISARLTTRNMPDPDLLIRTGGEERISNFLLWQIAYTELYFTPVLWPDFDKEELQKAVAEYQRRERRFGKTSAQVREKDPN